MQLERDRILAKVDELRGYLDELKQIRPRSFEEYSKSIEKRRSTERLLQISIECVLDICGLIVSGLRLGLPSCEEDVLEKVESAAVFEPATMQKVKSMRAFRNILFIGTGASTTNLSSMFWRKNSRILRRLLKKRYA